MSGQFTDIILADFTVHSTNSPGIVVSLLVLEVSGIFLAKRADIFQTPAYIILQTFFSEVFLTCF